MLKYLLPFVLIAMAMASFEQECLDRHNKYRAMHSAEPLELDDEVQDTAQKYANWMASKGQFKHSGTDYGENIAGMGGSSDVKGSVPVDNWYKEKKDYDFDNPPPSFQDNTGHFTQVVWQGSKQLGCAYAVNGSTVYIVANYNPSGNVDGQFGDNVSEN